MKKVFLIISFFYLGSTLLAQDSDMVVDTVVKRFTEQLTYFPHE